MLAKFLAGYMLNKELSSVSHKNITKPYSIEGNKTDKGNFQHRNGIYHHFSDKN